MYSDVEIESSRVISRVCFICSERKFYTEDFWYRVTPDNLPSEQRCKQCIDFTNERPSGDFIYLFGSLIDGAEYFKVGYTSRNPYIRLKEVRLLVGSAILVHFVEGYRDQEQEIHRILSDFRADFPHQQEFYTAKPGLEEFIISLMNALPQRLVS